MEHLVLCTTNFNMTVSVQPTSLTCDSRMPQGAVLYVQGQIEKILCRSLLLQTGETAQVCQRLMTLTLSNSPGEEMLKQLGPGQN